MDNGNEFQSLGADDLNALSPSVTLNLTDAGVNNVPIWFLRLYLDGLKTVRRSLRYLGTKPCKHLKVNSNILKWIRYLIGNQCRSHSTGVIWQNLGKPTTSLAAAFYTLWSLAIWTSGRPYNKLLQKSNLLLTKACTKDSVVFRDKYFLILRIL